MWFSYLAFVFPFVLAGATAMFIRLHGALLAPACALAAFCIIWAVGGMAAELVPFIVAEAVLGVGLVRFSQWFARGFF